MATVKLQNDKVVLKDGKVSCSCCEQPGECCMYPAQAFFDGLYTVDDLPDTLLVRNGIFGEGAQPTSVLFTKTGTSPDLYTGENFYDGINHYFTIKLQTVNWQTGEPILLPYWAPFTEGDNFPYLLSLNPRCLIYREDDEENWSEDQFADTYSWLSDDPFAGDPYNPVSTTVTRVSLCRWEGPLLPFVEGTIFCKPVLYLYKGLNDVPNEYAFVWRMQWEGDQAETGGDKIGFNNTPVGEYDADPTPGTWVIS